MSSVIDVVEMTPLEAYLSELSEPLKQFIDDNFYDDDDKNKTWNDIMSLVNEMLIKIESDCNLK